MSMTTTAPDLLASYHLLRTTDPVSLLAPLITAEGGVLRAASLEECSYRPGRRVLARYAAQVERPRGVASEGWVCCAGEELSGAHLDSPAGPLSCWRVRDDPGLPGLRLILDPAAAGALLTSLGLDPAGLTLTLRTIRPLRRAVVEATTDTHRVFVKCVRPEAAEPLHRRHLAAAAADLPTPPSFGFADTLGLVVLGPLPGTSLRDLILRASPLPEPAAIKELLARFQEIELDLPARDQLAHLPSHLRLLGELLPEEAPRLELLRSSIEALPPVPPQVIHGDCYDAQILAQEGRLTGILDLDGTGLGDPAADAGNLLAHLTLLPHLAPAAAGAASFTAALRAELAASHDPQHLATHTAAALAGLATWPASQRAPGWEERTREILTLAEAALTP